MRTIKGNQRSLSVIITALAVAVSFTYAQTNLNFNNASATVEGAIRLSWNGTPNEYYEVDYADSLADTNTGTITWKALYEDYPSQGTNTFWLDTGNYLNDPEAPHPSKADMRFYRIVLSGTNTGPPPFVSILSPANGSSATGNIDVSVLAGSDQPLLSTKLFVDGQEMQDPSSTTNYTLGGTNYISDTYVLNTCEWPNGAHTLFATSECRSGPSGAPEVPATLIGRAVSAFHNATFDNLITRVSFSEAFFMPEDGDTQRVSAVFAANCNWALQILDVASNAVRTITGSGGSMVFNWDGTGNGGADLPVGTYMLLIHGTDEWSPASFARILWWQ